jgi:hypothetical protein
MAGTMKSEAKEKVSEEEKTEPQMTEKEKVAAIEQDRADQAEEDEWMEREAVREVRELVQVLGRWAEKGVSAEGVQTGLRRIVAQLYCCAPILYQIH